MVYCVTGHAVFQLAAMAVEGGFVAPGIQQLYRSLFCAGEVLFREASREMAPSTRRWE